MGNKVSEHRTDFDESRPLWRQALRILLTALLLSAAFSLIYFLQLQTHFDATDGDALAATLQFAMLSFAAFLALQLMQLLSVRRLLSNKALAASDRLHKLTQFNQDINLELAHQMVTLNLERDRAQQILDNAQAIIMTVHEDGSIASINRYGEEVTGFSGNELAGKSFVDLYTNRAALALTDLQNMAAIVNGERQTYRHETTLSCKDGSERTILWLHSQLSTGREGPMLLSAGLDITEHKQLEKRLSWLADHDSLTSLYNRRRFESELEQALSWAHEHQALSALLYIDLDNFKDVNDSCGHQAGDGILHQVSTTLDKLVGEIDDSSYPVCARLGGDEFAVILRNIDEESVGIISERILNALHRIQHSQEQIRFQLSCSIGIALFPGLENGPHELLSNADFAMYQAKSLGRNQYYTFKKRDAHRQQSEQRIVWRERIESALQQNRFLLHYQPILNIQTRTISHYETLIRLIDENGNLVSPDSFINMAENLGMIREVDHFIVDSAIAKQGQLLRQGHDITLAINLSGKAFDNPRLYEHIVDAIKRHRARAENLIFEITETAAVSDILAAEKVMSKIQSLGCQFALDDFGVGFSSFLYLRELPVEYVKIDGSFIRDLVNNTDNIVLVKALSEVAIGFNKLSVAEFVDSLQTLHILSEAKVNYAQGYFIGRPSQRIPVDPPNFYQAAVNERTGYY